MCCGCAKALGGSVCDTCRCFRLCLPRQPPDPRDRVWTPPADPLPRRLVLPDLPGPLDQRRLATCAANACASAVNYALGRRGHAGFLASRMFLYYNTRRHIMGVRDLAADCGSNLRDTCKALAKFGVCHEDAWPYTPRLLGREPPPHVYHAARCTPRCTYESVPQTLRHMLPCLARHHPILMGMVIFSNVRRVHAHGKLPMPQPGDAVLGTHAVLVCGFDLDTRHFAALNCWGGAWGDRGLFYIPFEYALQPTHCWDLWVLDFP